MIDDLVKRLRDAANSGGYDIYGLHCGLEFEAADRIEQLEAALRKIYGNGNATGCNPQIMCDIARAALGEKKNV